MCFCIGILLFNLPVAVKLPALRIVLARVEELARVPKPAETRLLVVLADVWGKVGDCDCTDVCGGFEWACLFLRGVLGAFDEVAVRGGPLVGAEVGGGGGGG